MVRVMGDEPFYAPNRTVSSTRQPKPGERLWTIRKSGKHYNAELRAHPHGVELQVFEDLEFMVGRLFPSREWAIAEGEGLKARYLHEGGVLVAG